MQEDPEYGSINAHVVTGLDEPVVVEEVMIRGSRAYVCRRVVHVVSFLSLGPLYYCFWARLGFGQKALGVFSIVFMMAEVVRIKAEILLYSQREYERSQVSALAWGILSLGLLFLCAPVSNNPGHYSWSSEAFIAVPIVSTLAIIDPLVGELKYHFTVKVRSAIAVVVAYGIWIACKYILGVSAPWWFLVLIPPISVAAEYPSLHYIDDNALMQLVPLVFALLLDPFLDTK